jgi:hypothetical protein
VRKVRKGGDKYYGVLNGSHRNELFVAYIIDAIIVSSDRYLSH